MRSPAPERGALPNRVFFTRDGLFLRVRAANLADSFTRQGTGTPDSMMAGEGGSYDTFREWAQSEGKIDGFDYSVGMSRLDTENARPNNNYRNTAAIADVGWSPNETLRVGSLFTYSV